ncbi:class I SAM-dependent methyltransferase [Christiangramia portivictoriae]|uniref:class I SAM-dependent methyltransferase n=1 Tax=Christiangramia portivictoriae TaxID=326069 RepID=UPI0004241A38|nr:class I SAM-dependent methyltransferase [Christiangramia portivictoriae]
MDKSNGYENIAKRFIQIRGEEIDGIGTSSVRNWIKSIPQNSTMLDLGCGTGIPITKVLVENKMKVYAIDASPTLISEFQKNLPYIPVECKAVENSEFFNIKFDAIIAWGLIFLLTSDNQVKLLQKIGNSLNPGGKFLFTAPKQKTEWTDILTNRKSRSLGAEKYKQILSKNDLTVIQEFKDEGENYYFETTKIRN